MPKKTETEIEKRIAKAGRKADLEREDIQSVATSIFKVDLTDEQVAETLERIPDEAEDDPTGDWTLWTENLLYQILDK